MTTKLEQVRDWHLARDREQRAVGYFIGATDHAGMAAAIDARLTQPAQSMDVGAIRKLKQLTDMRNKWEFDAREHLNTFGQHLPASVECLVEQFDAAMAEC